MKRREEKVKILKIVSKVVQSNEVISSGQGNGTIEFNEFAAMLEARRRSDKDHSSDTSTEPVDDNREDIERAFKVFDIDGDGLIDSKELRQTMERLGEEVTDDDVRAMMTAADRNKDGRIDFDGLSSILHEFF